MIKNRKVSKEKDAKEEIGFYDFIDPNFKFKQLTIKQSDQKNIVKLQTKIKNKIKIEP